MSAPVTAPTWSRFFWRLVGSIVLLYLALQFTSGWGDVGAVLAFLVV